MDQIYIPKNRSGFDIGNYVIIKPVILEESVKIAEKPYFYGIKELEPIKIRVIEEVFSIIRKLSNSKIDNIIITGSFLDKGFKFNDIDILFISDSKVNTNILKEQVEKLTGIKAHFIELNNKELAKGLASDPLYQSMISRCISIKRIIYNLEQRDVNYKLLDLHLLKSKVVLDAFDSLTGEEKYYHVRNVISIMLFITNKKPAKEHVDNKIKEIFNINDVNKIKNNILDKEEFIKNFKKVYNQTFNLILKNIKKQDASKQE